MFNDYPHPEAGAKIPLATTMEPDAVDASEELDRFICANYQDRSWSIRLDDAYRPLRVHPV